MEIDKIKEMLEYRFSLTTELPQKRHIIFWYDSKKEFKDLIDELNLTDVKIIKLTKSVDKKGEAIYTNIFKTKYTLEVIDTESNYLIYSEYPRAIDSENYLLDIEKYSEFFEADKSAMIVEELKLDRTNYRFGEIIREYSNFFGSKERREKLIKIIVQSMLGFRYDFKHICFSNNLYTGHIFCNIHSKEWRSRCIFGLQAITLVILTKANRTVCWQRKQECKSCCTVWYLK